MNITEKQLKRMLRVARKDAILECKEVVSFANLIPADEVKGSERYPHAGILDELEMRLYNLIKRRTP